MRVVQVVPFTSGSDSAEVVVGDGTFSCVAYSWPFPMRKGGEFSEPLHLVGLTSCKLVDDCDVIISRIDSVSLAHKGVAIVENPIEGLLAVGGLQFVADDRLPGGLQTGDSIEFECSRIDLW